MALVLSPNAKISSSFRPRFFSLSRSIQREITIAKNSRMLFALQADKIRDFGFTFSLQAVPQLVNPPNPSGQESEDVSLIGCLRVRPFNEILWLACFNKDNQSSILANSCLFSRTIKLPSFILTKESRRRRLLRKWRDSGITNEA